MADIKAFKGIRYNTEKLGCIDKLVSAPYDVISAEDRKHYHELHENNFVRLILGEEFPCDDEINNRFTRAGDYINKWLEEKVLIKEAEPSIYLYQQKFNTVKGKSIVNGFITSVKICEYDEKIILPHENTLSKPKGALAETIEKTNANLDCVYGLYNDQNYELEKIINKYVTTSPTLHAHDKDGNSHILWAISDKSDLEKIISFMADKQIAIADGHHRYETALKHRNKMRSKYGISDNAEYNYVMMTLVNVFEKDLTVLPTHRIIDNISYDIVSSLIQKTKDNFDIKEVNLENMTEIMAKENSLGLIMSDKAYTLRKKATTELNINASVYTKELELTILHKLILENIMGIDKEKLAAQTNVTYTRSFKEAVDLVKSQKAQMAFICNDIPVKAILDIAKEGEKMPQKATYFYPKLLSGLVIRKLDI